MGKPLQSLRAKRIDGLGRGEAFFLLFLCITCTAYESGLEKKPVLSQAVITVRTAVFYPGSCVFVISQPRILEEVFDSCDIEYGIYKLQNLMSSA